jgi:hypothetical protein
MDAGIIENTNSGDKDVTRYTAAESKLGELCAAALKRRGRRGRPKGTGRKHPGGCRPKTFRSFSPLAHGLLAMICLTGPEFMEQSEAEIVGSAGSDGTFPLQPESASGQAPRKGGPMIVDSVEALRAFGRRCQMRREQEKIDSVIRYYRNRTNPNLVRILDTTPLDGETRDARDLIASCYPRNPCGLYGCPCCGRRFKATAKLDVLKRIAAKCGGLPDPSVISFVTINGPTVPLEPSAVEPALRRFRATLTKSAAR